MCIRDSAYPLPVDLQHPVVVQPQEEGVIRVELAAQRAVEEFHLGIIEDGERGGAAGGCDGRRYPAEAVRLDR